MKLIFLITLLSVPQLPVFAADSPTGKNTESLFQEFRPETFRESKWGKKRINLDKVDYDLISAAVFHETNRRRLKNSLPALKHEPRLREAARMQSEIMAKRGSISHQNPKSDDKKSPVDRLRLAGMETAAFSAENVATSPGLEYEAGTSFYVREENGRKVFSTKADGPLIEPHTYAGFAVTLVNSWMDSPPHRKNILATEAKFLGADCRPVLDKMGMPVFYCTQVFYTPLQPVAPE